MDRPGRGNELKRIIGTIVLTVYEDDQDEKKYLLLSHQYGQPSQHRTLDSKEQVNNIVEGILNSKNPKFSIN